MVVGVAEYFEFLLGDILAQRLDYRPDIDGLRAVAVVLVVMYHLGVGFTKGGFVGVDVFFVISGYLITRIISAEAASGHFSLVGFYERRVRRCSRRFSLFWLSARS